MKKHFTTALAAGSMFLLFGLPCFAQSNSSQYPSQDQNQGANSQQSGTMNNENSMNNENGSWSDQHFVKEAAEGGMFEVKMGELAQNNGSSQNVKDFGKKMVDDHSKSNDELKEVAQKENITLPSQMGSKEMQQYDRLSKLSGQEFDREYAGLMVRDHQTDVHAFQREANNGKNADVKAFAAQTLPTLQEHLKLAQQLQNQEMGATGRSTSPSMK